MAQVKFAYGTKARYDALAPKDMDTLYFTTDTLQLFKGTTEYTKSTKMVSSLPAAGQVQGIIYFRMTDYTMHIWNGVEFVQLNKKTITQIPADATNDDVPTTKAVADYVQAKIEAVEQKKGLYVTDVTYKDGVISVAKNDEPVTTTLTGVVHAPTYDAETRTIKLPVFGGDTLTIALGKDLVVKSGIKAIKKAKEPDTKQNMKLTEHDKHLEDIDRKLKNDKEVLDLYRSKLLSLEEHQKEQDIVVEDHGRKIAGVEQRVNKSEHGINVMMKALLALLSHGIDGNAIDPMKEAKAALESYLIDGQNLKDI